MPIPKYSKLEIERRWLVEAEKLPDLGEVWAHINDRYLMCGRLRLRQLESCGETVYKLCKKYGGEQVYEAITNIYLDRQEFESLALLPAYPVLKKRYHIQGGSIDFYTSQAAEVAIFEMEFESEEEAAKYLPPSFVGTELKRDSDYSGYEIARSLALL